MFTSKAQLLSALKKAKISYKSSSDITLNLGARMGDFMHCPNCNTKIFDLRFDLKSLLNGQLPATFKHIEIEPSIGNDELLVAVVLECKNCRESIWRHVGLTEI